jgi:hypothetical protein
MATAFPIAPAIATSSPTPSPTTSTTSTAQSSTSAPGTSDKGAIIGGAVGGAAGLVVITMLLVWLWITRRRDGQRQRHTRDSEDDWYEKTRHSQATNFSNVHAAAALAHRPADPPNDAHPERASQSNLTETLSNPSLHAQRPERTFRVTNDTVPSSPVQTSGSTLPSVTSSSMMGQKSILSLQPSALPTSARQDGPSTDINVLARQVAAVMMQNTLDAGANSGSGTNPRDNSSVRSEPPDYVVHR